ncbi:MAG TPA: AMP-binding protein [Prolixibacteraceae bacterium]|nr:AMP-binding protein [Prolixibacteraceae bacterium]
MNTGKIIINNQELTTAEIKQMVKDLSVLDWKLKIYRFILDWFSDEDFILQKTSGSTGSPKEMALKKKAMTASAIATLNYFQLKPRDIAWLCLPIDYIAGKMMVVRSIIGRLNLLVSEPAGIPQIPDKTVSFAAMVPLQVKKLVDEKADFTHIKTLIIGGAEIDYSLLQAIKKIPTAVFATYGMTETCSHIALQQINGANPDHHFKTLSGITVGINLSGCLTIFAPELSDIPIQTTDLAEIISSTEFRWLGRADNVINSGGIKISPEEVEAAIRPLIRSEFLISSKEDKTFGAKVVLVIEGSSKDTETLLREIQKITDRYKAPKEVIFLEKIPFNASMKIDRKKVKQLINQNY